MIRQLVEVKFIPATITFVNTFDFDILKKEFETLRDAESSRFLTLRAAVTIGIQVSRKATRAIQSTARITHAWLVR
jgi:hypothetical protein